MGEALVLGANQYRFESYMKHLTRVYYNGYYVSLPMRRLGFDSLYPHLTLTQNIMHPREITTHLNSLSERKFSHGSSFLDGFFIEEVTGCDNKEKYLEVIKTQRLPRIVIGDNTLDDICAFFNL